MSHELPAACKVCLTLHWKKKYEISNVVLKRTGISESTSYEVKDRHSFTSFEK